MAWVVAASAAVGAILATNERVQGYANAVLVAGKDAFEIGTNNWTIAAAGAALLGLVVLLAIMLRSWTVRHPGCVRDRQPALCVFQGSA